MFSAWYEPRRRNAFCGGLRASWQQFGNQGFGTVRVDVVSRRCLQGRIDAVGRGLRNDRIQFVNQAFLSRGGIIVGNGNHPLGLASFHRGLLSRRKLAVSQIFFTRRCIACIAWRSSRGVIFGGM